MQTIPAAYLHNLSAIAVPGIEVFFILIIIGCIAYLVINWVLKRFIKTNSTRKVVGVISSIIVTPFIYLALIELYIFFLFRTPQNKFSTTDWMNDKDNRFQMTRDLVGSRILIGKDSNQLKQLLGSPDRRNDSLQRWNYDMGMGGGGLGFLFHNLEIKFDRDTVFNVEHFQIQD